MSFKKLPALTAVILLVLPVSGTAASDLYESSRYQRMVNTLLIAGDTAQQTDFASTALAELIAIYVAETDLARSEAREKESAARLYSWARGVDVYADNLITMLEDLNVFGQVSVEVLERGEVRIEVGEQSAIISHPRPSQQRLLEQRIIADFCARNDCYRPVAQSPGKAPNPVSTISVTPSWTFERDGVFCSAEGVVIDFGAPERLAQKREICQQFFRELMALYNELDWQRRNGVVVQWKHWSISSAADRPEHLVMLNAFGDALLLALPLIYSSPGMSVDIQPWLSARLDGDFSRLALDSMDYNW